MSKSHASRTARWLALPLLALTLVAIALPFALRSGEVLWACVSGADCAAGELVEDRYYLRALLNTVWLSGLSTVLALAIGTAAAVGLNRLPRWQRPASVMVNLGANFAGVPLALALALLFGAQGIVTVSLAGLGWSLPFDLQDSSGLLLAYLCFQTPLATLMLRPAVVMLDGGLQEAASTLGASPAMFWRRVGLPLLAPSLTEVGSLLFANAAAAYATPFALSGTSANVLAVRIAALVSGDIFAQPELAALLALVMAAMLAAVLMTGRWWAARQRQGTLA
jgi:putative spermidine/putrescine transport system permease protein